MKSFLTFISEGGNIQVDGVSADEILVSKIDRTKFVKELTSNLLILNKVFSSIYGMPLWGNDSFITSGAVFSGSSEHFINLKISDKDYGKFKPSTGDIDIQVPNVFEKQLHEFFKKNKKFGSMTYLGQSAASIGQISSLFAFNKLNIQLDFEFVEVDGAGKPSAWAKFSRSSNWKDIEQGIKGVMHKFAIACLDHVFTFTINLRKGKRNPTVTKQEVHLFAFSVQHGLRPKYHKVDEKADVWEEIDSKSGEYTRDISDIFEKLFKKKATKSDIDSFNSFVGIINMLAKFFDKNQQAKFVDAFAEFIFGARAQKLYRGNPLKDAEVKHAAMDYIERTLGIKKSKYEAMINAYYDKY